MKTTLLLLALVAATPVLAETPGERLDRCSLTTPRDMSPACTILRAERTAQVLACLQAPVKAGLSQLANAPAGASHRARALQMRCLAMVDQQLRAGGN